MYLIILCIFKLALLSFSQSLKLIKIDRNMSEISQTVCNNTLLTLVRLLVLLYEYQLFFSCSSLLSLHLFGDNTEEIPHQNHNVRNSNFPSYELIIHFNFLIEVLDCSNKSYYSHAMQKKYKLNNKQFTNKTTKGINYV